MRFCCTTLIRQNAGEAIYQNKVLPFHLLHNEVFLKEQVEIYFSLQCLDRGFGVCFVNVF